MTRRTTRGDDAALPQSEQKRRSILDAALRVVGSGGTEAVTHRRVAAEAGVPLGSTTYYFASRDDLLREAFRHHAAAVYGAIDEVADAMPLRTAADVVSFLIGIVRRELDERALILVEYELIVRAARDPSLAREVNAYERALGARLGDALERLGVARSFEAARTLIALVRGFELECLTRPEPEIGALQARLETVLGALASGGARPGRVSASTTPAAARAARRDGRARRTRRTA